MIRPFGVAINPGVGDAVDQARTHQAVVDPAVADLGDSNILTQPDRSPCIDKSARLGRVGSDVLDVLPGFGKEVHVSKEHGLVGYSRLIAEDPTHRLVGMLTGPGSALARGGFMSLPDGGDLGQAGLAAQVAEMGRVDPQRRFGNFHDSFDGAPLPC